MPRASRSPWVALLVVCAAVGAAAAAFACEGFEVSPDGVMVPAVHPPGRNASYDACATYQLQTGTVAANVPATCSGWLDVPDAPGACPKPKYARDFRRRLSIVRDPSRPGHVSARLDKSPLASASAEGALVDVAERMYGAVPVRWPLGPTSVPTASEKKRCGRLALEEIKRYGMINEPEQAAITKHLVAKRLID